MEMGDTPHPASAVPPLATLKQNSTLAVNFLRLHKIRCNIPQFVCPCADFFMVGPPSVTLCQDGTWLAVIPPTGQNPGIARQLQCPLAFYHARAEGVGV